jgi:hypothetical protein
MVLAVTYTFHRFPLPISYDHAFDVTSSPHFIVDSIWLKISFFFLEIMVSHMATSYGLQIAQVNKKPALELSLNLTLMHILMMKNPNRERCVLVVKSIPLELDTTSFPQTLAP